MSFSYSRYDNRRKQSSTSGRSTLGYWVPLIFTVTVATAGLAAWVWSERQEDDDDSTDADLSYGEESKNKRDPNSKAPMGAYHDEEGLVSRVQGAIRRTPSPQQLFDSVSKKTAAGVAAAGATVGAVLASIREEDKDRDIDDFGDHSRWSEEAALRRNVAAESAQSAAAVEAQTKSFAASVRGAQGAYTGKRRTVVIVVSAESVADEHDESARHNENATILSLLPDTDFSRTKLFVLIYSPTQQSRTPSRAGAASLGSSYSAISTPIHTPGEELKSGEPREDDYMSARRKSTSSSTSLFTTLQSQASRLVENPAMVMPFSTPTGYVHMLRHIAPDLVYIVDALSGSQGGNILDLKRWVGQIVVVVDSDGGSGLGALVDTDDEEDRRKKGKGKGGVSEHGHLRDEKWWENTEIVGLGKGVEIVDAGRLGEDFERRVAGRE